MNWEDLLAQLMRLTTVLFVADPDQPGGMRVEFWL